MTEVTTSQRPIPLLARLLLCGLCASLLLMACARSPWQYDRSEDSQPYLSVDTIRLDTLYSTLSSATYVAMIYNPHEGPLLLDEVMLLSGGSKGYRINVDGRSGQELHNITLPPRDSLYLFVEATFAAGDSDLPTLVTDSLVWSCNGRKSYTRIEGYRQNVSILPPNLHIAKDTLWAAERPYLITDSITIEPGARLTVAEGGHLLMPQGGRIVVRGALTLAGSVSNPILIEGIRRDNLTTDVSYRLLPNQWDYIHFTAESRDNEIRYATICNGREGLRFDKATDLAAERLTLESSTITNMGGNGLTLAGGRYLLRTSELSNVGGTCLSLEGATVEAVQMSMVCDYLFEHRRDPILYVGRGSHLQLLNSIIDGRQTYAMTSDTLRRSGELAWHPSVQRQLDLQQCYVRLEQDSIVASRLVKELFPTSYRANHPFVDSYWMLGKDYKDRSNRQAPYHFHFDFHPVEAVGLQSLSPIAPVACGLDRMGVPRRVNARGGYTLGAYEAVPTPEEPKR